MTLLLRPSLSLTFTLTFALFSRHWPLSSSAFLFFLFTDILAGAHTRRHRFFRFCDNKKKQKQKQVREKRVRRERPGDGSARPAFRRRTPAGGERERRPLVAIH